ncbi:lysostaphin resistance A-like protein [Haloferacaceae archaeon DSL9]
MATLRRIFWNESQRRLRLPWRLLLGGVAIGVISTLSVVALVVLVGQAVLSGLFVGAFGEAANTLVAGVVSGAGTAVAVWLVGRYLDRRPFSDFGLRIDRDWWLDLGFGLGLGGALMTGIFLVQLAAGWIAVEGTFEAVGSFLWGFLGILVLFLVVGVYEELLVRGYLLTNVAEGFNGFGPIGLRGAVVLATIISSLVFGALHASNPNATAVSVGAISLAGVLLAFGYLLTGELAIPIGLHITWNLFQGAVYGFPVSGLSVPATIIAVEQGGPDAVTGGAFGPEAGLIGIAAMAAGMAATVGYVNYRYGTVRLAPEVGTPRLRSKAGEKKEENEDE